MSDTERFHISSMAIGEPPAADDEYRVRRRIGAALKEIADDLIRADADMASLEQIAQALDAVRGHTCGFTRRPQKEIYDRLFTGRASRRDLLDLLDYEVFTGRSTPVSPPMELWLDGDVVRGKATLGLTFQGPPGRVHGGIIAAMLDVLMAKTQDITRTIGVTGTLNIRFIRATPIDTEIAMEARVLRTEGRKLFNEGRFFVNGEQTVHAEGIWIATHAWG